MEFTQIKPVCGWTRSNLVAYTALNKEVKISQIAMFELRIVQNAICRIPIIKKETSSLSE